MYIYCKFCIACNIIHIMKEDEGKYNPSFMKAICHDEFTKSSGFN